MDCTSFKVIVIALATKYSLCTIDGLTYYDPLNFKPLPPISGSDPCNPLYWYPKNIPEYCYIRTPSYVPDPGPNPLPMPIPVSEPKQNLIIPLSEPEPCSTAAPAPDPVPSPVLPVMPIPLAPLPYGLPIAPSNPMMPVASAYRDQPLLPCPYPQMPPYPPGYEYHPCYSYPGSYPLPQVAGMIPGIESMAPRDGGFNILPFTDVYTEMFRRHRYKMLRKRFGYRGR